MDFPSVKAAAERLAEEVEELLTVIDSGDKSAVADEGGDVLFSAVNTVRLAGADCEEALRLSVKKFTARFAECERMIVADGKDMTELGEEELDEYWKRAKNALKSN